MARIARRRMFWDPPAATDVTSYEVYAGPPGPGFGGEVDAGNVPVHATVSDPEYFIENLPEGNHQFVVVAVDDAGNRSDPYQHPAWADVPLDVTPPDPPSGGGLD